MLDNIKYTIKHTVIYSLGNMSTKLIGLVLLPLYTSYLTTDEYGMFALLEVTSQILVAFMGFRLATAMLRFSSGEKSVQKRKSIVFISIIITFLSVVVMNVVMQPFNKELSILFFDNPDFEDYFFLLFIWSSFEIFNRLFMNYLRLHEKPVNYMIMTVIKVTTILLLNIYFIVSLEMGIKGIILSQLIGSALVFVIILPQMVRGMNLVFDYELFKGMFKYGFPLVFSGLSMLLLSLGDRYLLKYFLSFSEVGIYSLAYKVAGLVNMLLIQSFQLGFLPIAFKMYSKPNAKRYFSKVLTYYTYILIIVSLAVSIYAREILVLLSKRDSYVVAYTVIPIIILAFIFKGMQFVFSIGLHYAKKTQYNAVIITVLVFFNVGLNIILIPWISFYGAAVSAVISNVLMTGFFYYYSQKLYQIPFELKKVYLMFLIGFGLFGIGIFANELNLIIAIIVKLFIILSFPVILYFFNFYEKIELKTALGFYKKWRNPANWAKNFKR